MPGDLLRLRELGRGGAEAPAWRREVPRDDGGEGEFPGRRRAPHDFPSVIGEAPGTGCDGIRQLLVGAGLAVTLQPTDVVPFERLYRRRPRQGVHGAINPQRPFMIELGSFQVPQDRALLIYDMRPDVYRSTGVDPFDVVPVEERRFARSLTFDVTVNGNRRPGNKSFEIDPILPQQEKNEFVPELPTDISQLRPQTEFNQAAANQFGQGAGAGKDLLPQRPTRYGALNAPFSLFLNQFDTFSAWAVFVRPVKFPLAFIEFDFAGFEMPLNMAKRLLGCLHPLSATAGVE